MFVVSGGRSSLWQWDINCQVYSNAEYDRVDFVRGDTILSVKPLEASRGTLANVPNELLQEAGAITVYGAKDDNPATYTASRSVINVEARPMPADYVLEPTQV